MKPLIVIIICVIAITTMELYALSKGINGIALSLAIGSVFGIGGTQYRKFWDSVKSKRG